MHLLDTLLYGKTTLKNYDDYSNFFSVRIFQILIVLK